MFQYRGRRYSDEEKDKLKSIVHTLKPSEIEVIQDDFWNIWGRKEQTLYLDNDAWKWWIILSGRGWGKTLTGVKWSVWKMMHSPTPLRGAVVCRTDKDVVGTIIDGDSGYMAKSPKSFYPIWHKKDNSLTFPNGSIVRCFSSETPDSLRGPNFHWAWGDEVCSWNGMENGDTWVIKMLLYCTRIGDRNQILWTSTPRNIPWIRDQVQNALDPKKRIVITRGSSYENRANLTQDYFEILMEEEGTLLGRQEIHGEILNLVGQQPIQREWIKIWPGKKNLPMFKMIVVSLDTAFTDKEINDPSGMVTLGLFFDTVANDWSGMILDTWTKWLTYPYLKQVVKDMWKTEYGAGFHPGEKPTYILIENRASGQSLGPDLTNEDVVVSLAQPQRDKGERLSEVSPLIEAGRLWVVGDYEGKEMATWVSPLITRLVNYPVIDIDDDIDALSQVLKHLKTGKWMEFEGRNRKRPDFNRSIEYGPRVNPYAQ